ncbi:hypothetical protein C900_01956 [Fulvivirga imtechensis AK7]|uniref:DNA alkylation repair enzyme n=1 Tax=Fulvivirga imtechensis AK7 TaxID=1237149 RepID=L8JSL3_9BACT|nr:DNA alkylation repair protein [Fulvivirga imtechensis]ELR71961.1 hypothetical protein C900_01956 [Fulvivirga imtechensis AK7]
MTLQEILIRLKSLSHEKMYAHNVKNGAGENQFGVKLGDLRKMAKEVRTNHELALELWKTGNIDARLLSILIMKPKSLTADELNEMVKSIRFVQVADWFNAYIIKEHAERDFLREKWLNSDNIWAARAGWSLTAGRVARDAEGLDLNKILERLESEMAKVAPEVQWTMNSALAQIGIDHPKHRKRAIEIDEKLGIYRDYPVSKGCTSPFAPIWINEIVKRQKLT